MQYSASDMTYSNIRLIVSQTLDLSICRQKQTRSLTISGGLFIIRIIVYLSCLFLSISVCLSLFIIIVYIQLGLHWPCVYLLYEITLSYILWLERGTEKMLLQRT